MSNVTPTFEPNNQGSTYPDEEPPLPRIVTGSFPEKLILCLYLLICVMYIPCVNSLIIHGIRKTPSLHTPQYFLISCYAICDILFSLSGLPGMFAALVGNISEVPPWVCQILGTVGAGVFFSSSWTLGLIAYERHYKFFHPLTYVLHFTRCRLTFLAVAPHVIGQGFSVFIGVYFGRRFYTTVLVCNSSEEDLLFLNPIVVVLFYLPSALMSLVCVARLMLLVQRQQHEVHALRSVVPRVRKSVSVRKAIKIVLLVSDAFWGILLPTMVCRTAVFSSGATWQDMDTRRNMGAYGIVRTSTFVNVTVTALINPVIYLTIHKDLRNVCKRLIGR